MPSIKSTYWSITGFNDDIQLLHNNDEYPEFVDKVYGGEEQCPTTGRIHFQGMVKCHRQVRFTQIKEWLKQSHIEPAKSVDALQKYVMKKDTAVGDKDERSNTASYFGYYDFLVLIAKYRKGFNLESALNSTHNMDDLYDREYWYCVNQIVLTSFARADTTHTPPWPERNLIDKLLSISALPAPRLLWKRIRHTIIEIADANNNKET